jgi:hypothetical protein
VAESFDLPMARKLAEMVLDAQGTGDMRMAHWTRPERMPMGGMPTLSGGLVHLFAESGVMKDAVQAEMRVAAQSR